MQKVEKYVQLACKTCMRPARGYKGNAKILVPGNANLALEGDERP